MGLRLPGFLVLTEQQRRCSVLLAHGLRDPLIIIEIDALRIDRPGIAGRIGGGFLLLRGFAIVTRGYPCLIARYNAFRAARMD